MDFDNDAMLIGEEGADNLNKDITIGTDDEETKESPKDEPKMPEDNSDKKDSEEKKSDEPSNVEPTDDKKVESKEDDDDLDLSDLFADIEDSTAAVENSEKILDNTDPNGGLSKEQVIELQAQLSTFKEINTKQAVQIKKLMNDSVDIFYKNAELEAFGGVSTNPNVLILSKNLEKAQSGNDLAKSKVVSVLKSLYEEFTGNDLDKEGIDKQTDILAATSKYNSIANPNLKLGKDNDIEGLSM